jgi:hypothetical protein
LGRYSRIMCRYLARAEGQKERMPRTVRSGLIMFYFLLREGKHFSKRIGELTNTQQNKIEN